MTAFARPLMRKGLLIHRSYELDKLVIEPICVFKKRRMTNAPWDMLKGEHPEQRQQDSLSSRQDEAVQRAVTNKDFELQRS